MSKAERIIIFDSQVLQTPAWHRGMGKYTLALLRALAPLLSDMPGIRPIVLLNKNLPTDSDMYDELQEAVKGFEIIYTDLLTIADHKSYVYLQEENQKRIDAFTARLAGKTPVDYIIMSLFLQEAVAVYPAVARKILLFYDLIPMMYHRRYLGLGPSEQHFVHFKTLFASDIFLPISKTVANDLTLYLGIDRKRIVDIDGAPISRVIEDGQETSPAKDSRPYILMPTGGELRKNNHRAVEGFELFNQAHDYAYDLYLTSSFGDGTVAELNAISKHLKFTGNISESELHQLYLDSAAVLFPSEYEGLGLPVLEAAEVNKPIACSDIAVFREMSTEAFYFFNPLDPQEIAAALMEVQKGLGLDQKLAHYPAILAQYTWENSAKTVVSTILEGDFPRRESATVRAAVIAPNVSANSEEGRLAGLLHPLLADQMEVDYYYDFGIEPAGVRPNHLAYAAKTYPITDFTTEAYADYDIVIYHITDDQFSARSILKALHLPGIVIVHAADLKNLFYLGSKNSLFDQTRLQAESRLNSSYETSTYGASLVDQSKGIIVLDGALAPTWGHVSEKLATPMHQVTFPVQSLPYIVDRTDRGNYTVGIYLQTADDANRELVEELAERFEQGYCDIILFSRNRLPRSEKRTMGLLKNVREVRDDLTDFETEDLLMHLDALVDYKSGYRTTGEMTLLYGARRQGVTVVANGMQGASFEPFAGLKDEDAVVDSLLGLALTRNHKPAPYDTASINELADKIMEIHNER